MMDMALGILDFETREIFDFSSSDVIDVFAFRKFAMKKLQESGYAVLPADDFETVMLRHFCTGRQVFDRYIRAKLGKKPQLAGHEEEYAKQLLSLLGVANVSKLLYICRFCSYLGGPGSPDYIAGKDERAEFFYVGNEFFRHQQLFMLLSSLLGFDVVVLPVDGGKFSIDAAELLNYMLAGEKAMRQQAAIDASLVALMQEIPTKQVADAISYLEEEKAIMPFELLKKWLSRGRAEAGDLNLLFERVEYIIDKRDREFRHFIEELKKDEASSAFGPARDEATMRKKAAYIEEKFGICDVKAKDLLNFV